MDDVTSFCVLDGGMATELMRMGCSNIGTDPLWSSKLLKSDPEQAIKSVHRDFLAAGSDVIETNTYQANIGHVCKCLGVTSEEAVMLVKQGAQMALEARDEFWETRNKEEERQRPLVAGSVGPYGACLTDGSEYTGCYIENVTEEFLMDWHRPHVKAMVEAGVDLVAFDTIPAVAEGQALVKLMKEFPGSKAWLSFSCKDNGLTRRGESVSDIIESVLTSKEVIAVGCNCCNPGDVEGVLEKLQPLRGKKILVVFPNSGEQWLNKEWCGKADCRPLHEYVPGWVQLGAKWIGGCCRVYPEDIILIRTALKHLSDTMK